MTPACVEAFIALAGSDLAQPEAGVLADEDVARILTAAVKLYAARAEARDRFPAPLERGEVTATDVAITVSEMIHAVDINLFDLSMWHGRQHNNRAG
jgi:hypothetical protein